ncbi:MAG: TetR family transcriptional regulator [Acidobacteria bacterium]|nr:TetR family transcriptional regulator [Acidobacteriota bacterium]
MRGRPREFDKDQALGEAMRVFWRQGFNGTAVADLEEAMGLGRQSIYNAFGDKEQLFDAALELYLDAGMKPITEVLDREGSALGNVLDVLEMWENHHGDGNGNGCLLANSICEHEAMPGERDALFRGAVERLEGAFARAFDRAQEQGELSAARDPAALGRLFATLGQGLSVMSRVQSPEFMIGAIQGARQLITA